MKIPVIDVFAGPGGLGEGFSSFENENGERVFEVTLSIEKDKYAWQTLLLRSFFRQYPKGKAPDSYYKFIKKKGYVDIEKFEDLIVDDPVAQDNFKRARNIAWNATLGKEGNITEEEIDERISEALINDDGESVENWLLVGGPPCQAYSLVGRSRNGGIDPEDPKVHLYKDYYRILAVHNPPVFVMENVKGLLSATVEENPAFEQILRDIKDPVQAYSKLNGKDTHVSSCPGYYIYSFVREPREDQDSLFENDEPNFKHRDYVIRSEEYGIPQARHRVILLGIRKDLKDLEPGVLAVKDKDITLRDVLDGLPPVRSGLSKRKDSVQNWKRELLRLKSDVVDDVNISLAEDLFTPDERKNILKIKSLRDWIARALILRTYFILDSVEDKYPSVADKMNEVLSTIKNSAPQSRGNEFMSLNCSISPNDEELRSWYLDKRIGGVCNHSARGHMSSDLYRYLFISSFGEIEKRSPKLEDFPSDLLPNHQNVNEGVKNAKFADRFRVQLWDEPSKTVTSHISKDGHYYIHPDPNQCRSLTVREAARIQTFPDNYFFCGPRTSQYIQVGNAVPPLLARQIAGVVKTIFGETNERINRRVKQKI